MIKFFAGVVFGIIIATHGFSGVVNFLDSSVETVKDVSAEVMKK